MGSHSQRGAAIPPQGPAPAPRDLVTTQVSLGGFDARVSALELAEFLEYEAGQVLRCRVKTSWTPQNSYPDFLHPTASPSVVAPPDFNRVPPHAFVHFALPEAARRATDAAGKSELLFNGKPLHAASALVSSLRASRRRSTEPFRFPDARLEVGALPATDTFLAAWRGPAEGLEFLVDPFDLCCRLVFTRNTAFTFHGYPGFLLMRCDVKLEFPVRDIAEVRVYRNDCSLLLRLTAVPLVYYRTADDDIHVSVPFDLLDDDDPWIRTSDITPSGAIGRCGVYRLTVSPRKWTKMDRALAYLKERRVAIVECGGWLGARGGLKVRDEPEFGEPMHDLFFCVQHAEGLKFQVLFLVNALVHKGIINQHQLTPDFFSLLRGRDDDVNVAALRDFWGDKFPVFDAPRRLKKAQDRVARNSRLLRSGRVGDCYTEVRRLVITPTRAYCLPPEVELSNRVIRHYQDVADRFLRVTFMDEGMQLLNNNVLNSYTAPIVRDLMLNSSQQKTTVYKRVRTFLTDGFHMCGRKYSFLAFSTNQLRDKSAWFFAEERKTTVESIRRWMGRFTSKNVAKHAARMGQCFSSTYATVMVQPEEVNENLEDVERNEYIFSDGIGKITPDLAMEVAERLPMDDSPPSAYQIRYAGFKGVIAVWPGHNDGIRLSLRPSMRKFESTHSVLEVCNWTRFQPGFLNRQIIILLSSLKVPDVIFWKMQESMLCNLNNILLDRDVAFEVVTNSCGEDGNTAALMLTAGFGPGTEPHLKAMLLAIRSAQLQNLLEKTRIFVPKGRWLMGCLDELGVLEQGQCFIRASAPSPLDQYFVKHGSRFSSAKINAEIIVGTVVIAKNPCLHPGDVRILEAVDVPELHHLVDCLVFPKNGDRPHPNEASGSDLDGDLYFVTWDEKLIPPGKKSWNPMDYSPSEAKQQQRQVSQHDIIDFFLKNMISENLGVICHAHVVHADLSEYGAMDEKCIHLAELAATAVDFPKTGKLVTMPPDLRPKIYPDFMQKDDVISYKSEKILGRLYRSIQEASNGDLVSEEACTLIDLPYDADLEVPGASDFLASAWQCKCSYEAQLSALLNQYRVRTEAELVTGYILSLAKHNSRKQGEIKERLKNAYHALRKEFRAIFESIMSDQCDISDDAKNLVYEMQASAWYQVTYHSKWVEKSRAMVEPDDEEMPARLSFPWIAVDYLVRIKLRCHGEVKVEGRKPVEKLAAYISERI